MTDAPPSLVELFRDGHEELLAITRRVIALMPSQREYSDEELDQILRGFERIALDALEDRGSDSRQLFIESVVPAYAAQGQTPPMFAEGTTMFAVLLTAYVVDRVDPGEQERATAWLARFFADYARETVDVAIRERA